MLNDVILLIKGYKRVKSTYFSQLPPIGTKLDIVHFGCSPGTYIYQTGYVDKYGICPDDTDGHCNRSTITHWRIKNG